MKNILKAIGAGLALGGAFFLVPFLGHILLFVMLLRVAFRLMGGRRWRRSRGRWQHWAAQHPGDFGPLSGAPVPIDNQWYRPAPAASGPASYVPVS